jgi:copper homeostasis protein (lipoprotein)
MIVLTGFAVEKFNRGVYVSATLAVVGPGAVSEMSREFLLFRRSGVWGTCARLFLLTVLLLSSAPLFAKTVTLSGTDNNTSICLIEGDTLVITLPSPIPDAYRWARHLAKASPLTALHDDYAAPKDAKGVGTQTFRFNAASAGKTALALNFERQKEGPAPQATQTFTVEVTIASGEPASAVLIGTYKGTTACADCTGIQTELRLYAKGKNDFTDTLYLSTRTYLGGRGGEQSFTDRGEWAVMKGDAVDPNATVYALRPDQPEQAQYFLLQPDGGTLTGLDGQMKPIDAPAMYQSILKRVE